MKFKLLFMLTVLFCGVLLGPVTWTYSLSKKAKVFLPISTLPTSLKNKPFILPQGG